MDRLEEIKKEVTEIDSRLLFEFPDEYGILEDNILWLISEIEQLKKEKEWLKRKLRYEYIWEWGEERGNEMIEGAEKEMQQALKE